MAGQVVPKAAFAFLLAAAATTAPASSLGQSTRSCDDPGQACAGVVSEGCLSRAGAGSLRADAPQTRPDPATCRSQLEAYRQCLSQVVQSCGAATPTTPAPPRETSKTKTHVLRDRASARFCDDGVVAAFAFRPRPGDAPEGATVRSVALAEPTLFGPTQPILELTPTCALEFVEFRYLGSRRYEAHILERVSND